MPPSQQLINSMGEACAERLPAHLAELGIRLPAVDQESACRRLAEESIDAFAKMGLLSAARMFLSSARGSFGLVLSHSLDAHNELVVAARGQTMSISFYPQMGVVLFGSEAAVRGTLQRHTAEAVEAPLRVGPSVLPPTLSSVPRLHPCLACARASLAPLTHPPLASSPFPAGDQSRDGLLDRHGAGGV